MNKLSVFKRWFKGNKLQKLSWFSVNWRIASFELDYSNGEIHHAKKT